MEEFQDLAGAVNAASAKKAPKKGPRKWEDEEDEKLRGLIIADGTRNWKSTVNSQ